MSDLGELGISIGTDIAIESIISDEQKVNLKGFDLWLNSHTLIRNYISASDDVDSIDPEEAAIDIINEITLIVTHLSQYSAFMDCKVVVYFNTYAEIKKLFPMAIVKGLRTDKQKRNHKLVNDILDEIGTHEIDGVELVYGDCIIKGKNAKAIMLTHYPLDLLSVYSFSKLYLLESHTGALKDQGSWYSKLTGGKQLRLPLNKFTIQLYGDNSTMFYGHSIALKKLVTDIALRNQWTVHVSKEKIVKDLSIVKRNDPVAHLLLVEMYSGKLYF